MIDDDDISHELTDAEFDAIMRNIEEKRKIHNKRNQEFRLRQKQGITLKKWHHKYPDYKITKTDTGKIIAEKNGVIITAWTKWRMEQKIREWERTHKNA